MRNTDLCDANEAVGLEVRDFILNVPNVKEESITDYLLWKWNVLDARFKYIKTIPFTRQEENSATGADFELELWILGRTKCVPLLFQAKKFIKPFDSYVAKLNYPHNTQKQLKTLISYAASRSLLPFYAIYTSGPASKPLCRGRNNTNTGIYMIHANVMKDFASGVHGRKVSLDSLIRYSNPFHCMFCCPMGVNGGYFSSYFNAQPDNVVRSKNALPSYVRRILEMQAQPVNAEGKAQTRLEAELPPVRCIGVYDLDSLE